METNAELLRYLIDRTSRAYAEQIWAVALFSAMSGFLITSTKEALKLAPWKWMLQLGVCAASILTLAFIWSRHYIFLHYDGQARTLINISDPEPPHLPDWLWSAAKQLAEWSGISLYSVIIIVMTIIAMRTLRQRQKPVAPSKERTSFFEIQRKYKKGRRE